MKRIICIALIGLTWAILTPVTSDTAEARHHYRCAAFGATAYGITKGITTARAKGRLRRGARAWARKKKGRAKIGAFHTRCNPSKKWNWRCRAAARVCR